MAIYFTSETNKYDNLRTRWYVNNYEQCKKACLEIAKNLQYTIANVDDNFHEIFLNGSSYDITITISTFNFRETGIDFRIVSKSFLDFGKGKKEIDKYYKALDQKLQFKGISLHP